MSTPRTKGDTRVRRAIGKRIGLLVLLLIELAATAGAAQAQTSIVARVIDGDTFELTDGRRVRLIGIDTPEKHPSAKLNRDASRSGQDRATIQALGVRASDFASRLVEGRPVALEGDPANTASGHMDRYGRTLAYVWLLENGRPAALVNLEMIRAGYANAYTAYPFRHADRFRDAERSARAAGRGLWGDETASGSAAAPETASPGVRPADGPPGDRDCADFRTRRQAQAFFDVAGAGDPHRLDGDGDGLACERLR